MHLNSTTRFSYSVHDRVVGVILPESDEVVFESDIDSKISTTKGHIEAASALLQKIIQTGITLPQGKTVQAEFDAATARLRLLNRVNVQFRVLIDLRINGYVSDLFSDFPPQRSEQIISEIASKTNIKEKLVKFGELLCMTQIFKVRELLERNDPLFNACFNDCKRFTPSLNLV